MNYTVEMTKIIEELPELRKNLSNMADVTLVCVAG